MKKVLLALICLFSLSFSFSSSWEWTPDQIIDEMKSKVQDTKMDNAIPWQWAWIKESLQWVKSGTTGYIQWMWYIWLTFAVLLIIYNGIIILWNFGEENKLAKSKKRLLSIVVWVVVLTSAYFIINFVVGLVGGVFTK